MGKKRMKNNFEFVTFDDNEVIGSIYENKELVREYLWK